MFSLVKFHYGTQVVPTSWVDEDVVYYPPNSMKKQVVRLAINRSTPQENWVKYVGEVLSKDGKNFYIILFRLNMKFPYLNCIATRHRYIILFIQFRQL